MNTPRGINPIQSNEHGVSCSEDITGLSKELCSSSSSTDTRTDCDIAVVVQPTSSSSSPPAKKKCLVSPPIEGGVQEHHDTQHVVPLPLDVQHFMSNINITVSDYISQQYLVRGSPSYKVLKDKIREYCLSLKPSGMKDDTSCSVLYLVYQSLPELKRTDEADSIIRKMIGKHIRNAKYRAKCKLRECKLSEVDKATAFINKTESFVNCASWVTMLQAEVNKNKDSKNLELTASNLSDLRNTLTANLASFAAPTSCQMDHMPMIPAPTILSAGLTIPKVVTIPTVQNTNNTPNVVNPQLSRSLTNNDISSIIQNGSLAGSPVRGVNAPYTSPGRGASSSYTSPVQLLYNTLQSNSNILQSNTLHIPTVDHNNIGTLIAGDQIHIKREHFPSNVDVMISNNLISGNNLHTNACNNRMQNAPVHSVPSTVSHPAPATLHPGPLHTPHTTQHPGSLHATHTTQHPGTSDSDVSHVNNVCNHKLKFIAGITYACINCNDYFERLSPERLMCEYCKKQFTHKHLLLQHNNEVHATVPSL